MIDFLTAILGPDFVGGYVEFRMLQGETVLQSFGTLDHVDQVAIHKQDEMGFDVYYGVLRRQVQNGKADSIDDQTSVLWADLDAKSGRTKRDVLSDIAGDHRVPTPQVIVDSGQGLHVYWLLEAQMEWRNALLAMKGLADFLSGDHVYDKARILRIPGTHNHKNDENRPVRLLKFDLLTDRSKESEFADAIDRGYSLQYPASVSSKVNAMFSGQKSIDAWVADSILPGWLVKKMEHDPGKGARSEYAFGVICSLVELGLDDDSIEDLTAGYETGFGAKYHDRGMGHRWLKYTIDAARQTVAGQR